MGWLLSDRSREGTLRPTAKHAGQPEGMVPAMVGAAPGERAAGRWGPALVKPPAVPQPAGDGSLAQPGSPCARPCADR